MNDTHPLVQAEFDRRIAALSAETRLLMGCRMFEAAREMALASLPLGLSDGETKVFLCMRFYGADLHEEEREKILNALRGKT